jgi:rhamnulokinase
MMEPHHYIGCDLGAESGRVMLGTLEGGRLTLEEVHRFSNGPVAIVCTLRWDILKIFEELKTGLQKVARRSLAGVPSISCDSWGVDYVLLTSEEPMIGLPFHYRDARTEKAYERAFAVMSADEIFQETGIQFMTLNTLYQLHADLRARPGVLKAADQFLTIGDYFNYLFSGVRAVEESLASTTQCYNPFKGGWSETIINKFGFPMRIFPPIVPSGTRLGSLLPALAFETGLDPSVSVIATCSHDTGLAVAAVPAEEEGWAFLSSGTWSLVGVEIPRPIVNAKSRRYNFTNEVGHGRSIRFLKNIIGLWIVQECRREWMKQGHEYSYDELTRLAEGSKPLARIINPNDERFGKPGDMPAKIEAFCRETSQMPPREPAEYVRCVLDSLALLYRRTLDQLEDATGKDLRVLHIVGGGSRNRLLNQLSANATGRTVYAGPDECTAAGNVLIQALTLGHLGSLAEVRSVVRRSFPIERFEPQDTSAWAEAYGKFQSMIPPA